ncbi:MAG: pyruvate formate-lyase-activating protein [Pleomorphochaeta sp.]
MGKIHSIESFGTVDGPGIRFVIFFQGCPLRCKYCHNPDSWKTNAGKEMSVKTLLDEYERNKEFYKNGGITATGGEPLYQLEFLTKLFTEAKKRNIHTCLDTSAGCFDYKNKEKYNDLLLNTDLVLLDIKHSNEKAHKDLVGINMDRPLQFLKELDKNRIKVIIRHVLVPTISDSEDHLIMLGKILSPFSNIYGIDVLPYHKMGIKKYEELNISYPLLNIENATATQASEAKKIIIDSYYENRKMFKRDKYKV